MSAPLSIDTYDAQMLDFSSDPDVTMNITGSAEFFAEALMDHDGHLSTSAYGEHASVEVDMEEYIGDNAEYEMADETAEYHRLHGDEPLDVEVYDASHAPSPLVPPQPLQPSTDVPIDSEHPAPTSPAFTEPAALPELQGEPQSEVHPAPLDHPAADTPYVEPLASGEDISSEALPSSELAHPTDACDESTLPIGESHEQLGDTVHTIGQPSKTPAPADTIDEAAPHTPPIGEERPIDSGVAQDETSPEPPIAESAPPASSEEAYDGGSLLQDEKSADQTPATEREVANPLHISDGVYIDPPPAVLLSIAEPSQSRYVLFNLPEAEGESTGEPHGSRKAYSPLLEDRPTLYYEPLSSVFEALRQDEALLSLVPHSFEGELVLDAHDLQLAVSEDNVHSREISLHDLDILHDGSDFAGPLRLLLRAIVPRFIMRYYALQEQIQRLDVAAEPGQGDRDQEPHEEYEISEEQHFPRQEGAVNLTQVAVVSDSSEAPSTTAAEEPAKESVCPSEPTEETLQERYELEDTSGAEKLVVEYHGVTGEATTHPLEDEGDYEDINAGDEDESAKPESLDADQVHTATTEDTDAPATVIGQRSEFGGEQAEYLDYVQPEEYDGRYGEDLLRRAGGAFPVQYDEPPHYEEEAERDTSTAVDETLAILPGEDEDEEDKSVTTPVPVCAVLGPEVSEPADKHVTDELVLPHKGSSIPNSEETATSESANEVVHTEQASGNQETDTTQAKVFLTVDESDSNFVSILEREADTEFDRTFNAGQNEQEGSIEPAPHDESNWDEWDDEDAEGEDEEDWIDPDAVSNESSVTLSSKASSKRSYDEVDPSQEVYVEDPHASPGSKRPRVQ